MRVVKPLAAFCAGFASIISIAAQPSFFPRALSDAYYESGSNSLTVFSLSEGKIHIKFSGVCAYRLKGKLLENIGEATGIATRDGDTATFVPEGFGKCKLTLKFETNKLIVKQQGTDAECGFGRNVSAAGTYRLRHTSFTRLRLGGDRAPSA